MRKTTGTTESKKITLPTQTKLRIDRQILFIRAYETGTTIATACRQADISRTQYYAWREEDEHFRRLCEEIEDYRIDRLERSAFERAYNDTALTTFLLKHHRPKVYREESIQGVERKLVIICAPGVTASEVPQKIVDVQTVHPFSLVPNGNGHRE